MITKGSMYACDRCGATAFLTDAEAKGAKWQTITHIGADNVQVSRLLCEQCGMAYRAVAESQDKQFNDFMNGGN